MCDKIDFCSYYPYRESDIILEDCNIDKCLGYLENLDVDTVRYTSSGERGILKKGVANVISHSLSILWAMKGGHCWLVVFLQEVAILWFTPQYCDVVQYGASSNNKADLLRLHSYF